MLKDGISVIGYYSYPDLIDNESRSFWISYRSQVAYQKYRISKL